MKQTLAFLLVLSLTLGPSPTGVYPELSRRALRQTGLEENEDLRDQLSQALQKGNPDQLLRFAAHRFAQLVTAPPAAPPLASSGLEEGEAGMSRESWVMRTKPTTQPSRRTTALDAAGLEEQEGRVKGEGLRGIKEGLELSGSGARGGVSGNGQWPKATEQTRTAVEPSKGSTTSYAPPRSGDTQQANPIQPTMVVTNPALSSGGSFPKKSPATPAAKSILLKSASGLASIDRRPSVSMDLPRNSSLPQSQRMGKAASGLEEGNGKLEKLMEEADGPIREIRRGTGKFIAFLIEPSLTLADFRELLGMQSKFLPLKDYPLVILIPWNFENENYYLADHSYIVIRVIPKGFKAKQRDGLYTVFVNRPTDSQIPEHLLPAAITRILSLWQRQSRQDNKTLHWDASEIMVLKDLTQEDVWKAHRRWA